MLGKDLKALVKTIPNDAEVKIMIPDRNSVLEPKDPKITVNGDSVVIEANE